MNTKAPKPLWQKLGIREGIRLAAVQSPDHYFSLIQGAPPFELCETQEGNLDMIHLFHKEVGTLEPLLITFRKQIKSNGMIWVSWPKKSSRMAGDLNEDQIRELALDNGLVDVKVCSVDADWSGLKLVIPLKLRGN